MNKLDFLNDDYQEKRTIKKPLLLTRISNKELCILIIHPSCGKRSERHHRHQEGQVSY